MPAFDKDKFYEHVHSACPAAGEESIKSLADALLACRYGSATSWEDHKASLKAVLSEKGFAAVEEQKSYPFRVMEIDSVDTDDMKNILAYLDFTRCVHIDSELCRYLVESPRLENIKYDYMEQLFYVYRKGARETDKKRNFNLICGAFMATGSISVPMMYNIVNAYGKECSGGFPDTLDPVFSKCNLSDSATVNKLMEIIHILRITGNAENKRERNIAVASQLINKCFARDFYDPRSFIQMLLYYATVNDLAFDSLEKMVQKTAVSVLSKLLVGITDISRIGKMIKHSGISSKDWLDMAGYRAEGSAVIRELCSLTSLPADKLLERMERNIFCLNDSSATGPVGTYEIFCEQILSRMDYEPDNFVKFIVENKIFYEGFFEEHISYSRRREIQGVVIGDLEQMAYDIVFNDSLHREKIFYAGEHYGLYKFGSREYQAMDKTERSKYLYKELSKCFDFIKNYRGGRGSSRVFANISTVSYYPTVAETVGNRESFMSELIDKIMFFANVLNNPHGDRLDRSRIIYEVFVLCCTEYKCTADEFIEEVDDITEDLTCDGFYSLRFGDAMLYLCMKTPDPMKTFNDICSVPGYDFWK